MSAPIQPERQFDPSNVADWINVLHNATAVTPDSPNYARARAVASQAWARIGHLNRAANIQDRNAAEEQEPTSALASGVAGFAHGASLGLGEPIAGLIEHLTPASMGGKSFGEGAQKYREGMDRLEASNPNLAATAEIAGMVASALSPSRAVVGGLEAGQALGAGQVAGRIAGGAGTGAVLGGVSGFSEGGDDPGSIRQRLDAAKSGAGTGAVLGAALTGLGLRVERGKVEADADLAARGARRAKAASAARKAVTDERVALLREQRLQQVLDKGNAATEDAPIATTMQGVVNSTEPSMRAPIHPDIVDAVKAHAEGRISGEDLRVAMDVARGRVPADAAPVRRGGLTLEPANEQPIPVQPVQSATVPEVKPVILEETLARKQKGAKAGRYEKAKELYPKEDQMLARSKVVPAGPTQSAPPTTRMESPQETSHMTNLLASDTDLLKSQYELAQAFGGVNPRQLAAIAEELARRGVNVRAGGLTPEGAP